MRHPTRPLTATSQTRVDTATHAITALRTEDELTTAYNFLHDHWKRVRQQAAAKAAMSLTIGQRVSFEGRRGIRLTGHITRLSTTTALVQVERSSDPFSRIIGQQWRIPMNLLKPLATRQASTTSPVTNNPEEMEESL